MLASTLPRLIAVMEMHVTDWLERIRAEYLEIPNLCLTKSQVQRLWGLDPVMSDALLAALVYVNFLRCTHQNAYIRADGN